MRGVLHQLAPALFLVAASIAHMGHSREKPVIDVPISVGDFRFQGDIQVIRFRRKHTPALRKSRERHIGPHGPEAAFNDRAGAAAVIRQKPNGEAKEMPDDKQIDRLSYPPPLFQPIYSPLPYATSLAVFNAH